MSKLIGSNTKICKKCNIPKLLEEFSKNSKLKGGLQSICKTCEAIHRKEYKAKNGESVRRSALKYYNNNIEKYKEYNKRYKEENPEKVKESKRKSYFKTRRTQHEQHPLKFLLSRAKLRASKKGVPFDLTYDIMLDMWQKQDGKCHYSDLLMEYTYGKKSPLQVSLDRIDSNGGYTEQNSVLYCLSINYAKSDFTESQFTDFLKNICNNKECKV